MSPHETGPQTGPLDGEREPTLYDRIKARAEQKLGRRLTHSERSALVRKVLLVGFAMIEAVGEPPTDTEVPTGTGERREKW